MPTTDPRTGAPRPDWWTPELDQQKVKELAEENECLVEAFGDSLDRG